MKTISTEVRWLIRRDMAEVLAQDAGAVGQNDQVYPVADGRLSMSTTDGRNSGTTFCYLWQENESWLSI